MTETTGRKLGQHIVMTACLGRILTGKKGTTSTKLKKHSIVDCLLMMRNSSRIYFTDDRCCFMGSSALHADFLALKEA